MTEHHATEFDDKNQSSSTPSRQYGISFFLSVAIGVTLLVIFHFAVQHGRDVESKRQRGLTAFIASKVIQQAVDQPDSDGLYPPWSSNSETLLYDRQYVSPFYLPGPRYNGEVDSAEQSVLVATEIVDNRLGYRLREFPEDDRFFYIPYAVRNEKEGLALVDTCRAARNRRPWTEDLAAPAGEGSGGTDTFYRLRKTIQRDLQERHPELPEDNFLREQFPVLIERPRQGGGWVAFFGRQPQWMEYPGEFPMTTTFIEGLLALESDLPTETSR